MLALLLLLFTIFVEQKRKSLAAYSSHALHSSSLSIEPQIRIAA